MAKYTMTNLAELVSSLNATAEIINAAAANTINKAATKSKQLAIDAIVADVTLEKPYVSKHFKTVARASSNNLRAIIAATDRATLLSRYKHRFTGKDVVVQVTRNKGETLIKKAFRVTNLRGSASTGIAMLNRDAVKHFTEGGTPGKARKRQKIINKARTNPNGWTVLHSRSINQMFTTQRESIQPELKEFMATELMAQIRRKT